MNMQKTVFHVCTREDHSVIFRSDSEFKAGINLLGLCLKTYPGLQLYSFELMSNHIHILIVGEETAVRDFIKTYFKHLKSYFRYSGHPVETENLCPKFFAIDSEDYLRNVIVYINKNASNSSPSVTPFSYEWGTGRFFFNPEAIKRHISSQKPLNEKQRRLYSRSRKFDEVEGLYEVDGYISPLSFCDIDEAQKAFINPRQYIYSLTRNIESVSTIAKEIGETLTYSDYDLYPLIKSYVKEHYPESDASALKPSEKIAVARMMHFEYNASNKQISRILKIDVSSVNMMFTQNR